MNELLIKLGNLIRTNRKYNKYSTKELADKLQNLISDYDLYLKFGKDSLNTEANNYDELKWFYKTLQKLFNERINKNILLDRYNDIVEEYFC